MLTRERWHRKHCSQEVIYDHRRCCTVSHVSSLLFSSSTSCSPPGLSPLECKRAQVPTILKAKENKAKLHWHLLPFVSVFSLPLYGRSWKCHLHLVCPLSHFSQAHNWLFSLLFCNCPKLLNPMETFPFLSYLTSSALTSLLIPSLPLVSMMPPNPGSPTSQRLLSFTFTGYSSTLPEK